MERKHRKNTNGEAATRPSHKSLYVASHAAGIVGWPADAARPSSTGSWPSPLVYSHAWQEGDVVIWDNLATMYRATPFDDTRFKRDMRRTTYREKTMS